MNKKVIKIELVGNDVDDKVECKFDFGDHDVYEDAPVNQVFALILDAIKRSQ